MSGLCLLVSQFTSQYHYSVWSRMIEVPQQHHSKTAQFLPAELELKVSKHAILPL